MPEVGDRSTFAIEWQETRREDWSVYGYFCFWAGGQRIGIDYEDESYLSMTAEELRRFLSHSDERHLAFLDGTSKEEIYGYVYELGHGGSTPDEIIQVAQKRYEQEYPAHFRDMWAFLSRLSTVYYLHDVDYVAFDRLSIILIDDSSLGMQRLIWCDWNRNHQLFEVRVPDHMFEQVANAFLAAVNIPPQPTTLSDLFHQTGGAPIELDGQRIYRRYAHQVRGWSQVRVRWVSSIPSPVQGVRIKSGKVDLEFGGEYVRDLVLWADMIPETVSFRVIGQQGAVLKIGNVWRSQQEQDGVAYNYGNAGMIIEAERSMLRLQCSDGVGKPEFQDLVVEFMFDPGEPD